MRVDGDMWGFIECADLAGGCTMIPRSTYELILKKLIVPKELPVYAPHSTGHLAKGFVTSVSIDDFLPCHGFFSSRASQLDGIGRFLSEDYAFCERVRQAGGSLAIMAGATLTHTGSGYNLSGRYIDQIIG